VKLLRSVLSFYGPLAVDISFYRIWGCLFVPIHTQYDQAALRDIVAEQAVVETGRVFDSPEDAGRAIKDALDYIWRECGLEHP